MAEEESGKVAGVSKSVSGEEESGKRSGESFGGIVDTFPNARGGNVGRRSDNGIVYTGIHETSL